MTTTTTTKRTRRPTPDWLKAEDARSRRSGPADPARQRRRALAFVRRVDPDLFRAAALAEREAEVQRLREALAWARQEIIQDVDPDAIVFGLDAALADTPEPTP